MLPTDYLIVVEGELGPRYAAAFEPLRLVAADGQTELVGRVEDIAELHGILDTVAGLGLTLVSVAPVTDARPGQVHTQALMEREGGESARPDRA